MWSEVGWGGGEGGARLGVAVKGRHVASIFSFGSLEQLGEGCSW